MSDNHYITLRDFVNSFEDEILKIFPEYTRGSINEPGKIERFGKDKNCWVEVHENDHEKHGKWYLCKVGDHSDQTRDTIIKSYELDKKPRGRKPREFKTTLELYNKNCKIKDCTHPYLISKNITKIPESLDIRIDFFSNLCIPIYDNNCYLLSWQMIPCDCNSADKEKSKKRFRKGFGVSGGRLTIDGDDERIFLCEGFATGISIYEVTGARVVVCFSIGNIEKVLMDMKGKNNVILAVDNDQWREDGKNPGVETAKKLSSEYCVGYVFPTFNEEMAEHKPTDFNDMLKLLGFDKTKEELFKHPLLEKPAERPTSNYCNTGGMDGVQQKSGLNARYAAENYVEGLGLKCNILDGLIHDNDGELLDDDYVRELWSKLGYMGLNLKVTDVWNIAQLVGYREKVNPLKDFITRTPWDGKKRIDLYLDQIKFRFDISTDEAENKSLKKHKWYITFWRRWFICSVAKIFDTNISNTILVLQGGQGRRKTTFFKTLFDIKCCKGNMLISGGCDIFTKDFLINLTNNMFCLLDEIDKIYSANDVKRLKEIVTMTSHSVREPYARKSKNRDIISSFCATTNESAFLLDHTGNRRFRIVEIDEINIVPEYRDEKWMQQMYAEAYHFYLAGERLHYTNVEDAEIDKLTNEDFIEEDTAKIISVICEKGNDVCNMEEIFFLYDFNKKPTRREKGSLKTLLNNKGLDYKTVRTNDGTIKKGVSINKNKLFDNGLNRQRNTVT